MSDAQNSLSVSDPDPACAGSGPDNPAGLSAVPEGDDRDDFASDDASETSGHTLLSRPVAPEGRRSLFRR